MDRTLDVRKRASDPDQRMDEHSRLKGVIRIRRSDLEDFLQRQ